MHQINIFLHILAGIVAIFFGVLAFVSTKGGQGHRKNGYRFMAFMSVVVFTAAMGVIVFVDRPFLAVVTLQSAYMTFSGFRAIRRKDNGPAIPDWIALIIGITIVGFFLYQFQEANLVWNRGIIYYILGYTMLVLLVDLVRLSRPQWFRHTRYWLYDHIFKMTSAFVALVSAGAGTVLVDYAPWHQIGPAVLGTLWLVFCLLYYPRRMGKSKLRPRLEGSVA
jgi:hypothetical protein